MNTTRCLAALGITVLAATTLSASWAGEPAPAPRITTPSFDPAAFVHPVDNPWFPLMPGLVTRLRGVDDGDQMREVVKVTTHTKTILGVRATVFSDVLRRADGSLAEKTHDWYAADDEGNVWYLGEDTATYDEHGQVESHEGSWEAGKRGAQPGVLVPADAGTTSSATRPEFAKGRAEDQSWFVQHLGKLRSHGHRFHDVVRSLEWSRLEPGVISQKFYAAGLGIIAEHDLSGGEETFWLVSSHRP
jgi:hypothetical protein